MQTSSTIQSNDEYIPRDDESEAARLADASGVGEVSYLDDTDTIQYSMLDFGMGSSEGLIRNIER